MVIGVTSFETNHSVFNITHENNGFSITLSGHWNSESAEKTIDELNNLLEPISQNGIELHVQEVKKQGNQTKMADKEYKLSGCDTQENDILNDSKSANYHDRFNLQNAINK